MSWFTRLFAGWPFSALSLLLVWVLVRDVGFRVGLELVQTATCSRLAAPVELSNYGLSQDGDVVIGGLFNLHYKTSAIDLDFTQPPHFKPCTGLELGSLKLMYAMAFAVEEINGNPALLPNVKLSYRILDSCARYPWSLQGAMSLVGGDSYSCNSTYSVPHSALSGQIEKKRGSQSVPLIIGDASSTPTIILSRTLGPLSVPLISYHASCPCLSDRRQFPNFFRTIPSDVYQARTMAQLAIRFHWTWIGAVVSNNDYGRLAIQVFQEEVQGAGVCLAYLEKVTRQTIKRDARRAAATVQASIARVVLIFAWYTDVREILLELDKRNVTDIQFLASEAWSTSGDLLENSALSKIASGVLGVAVRSSPIPGFKNYLRSLHPSRRPGDVILREYWETEFGCSPGAARAPLTAHLAPCSGTETLERVHNDFTDTSHLRTPYNVYLAVYATAHALHNLLSCPHTDSSSKGKNSTCSSPNNIKPKELSQDRTPGVGQLVSPPVPVYCPLGPFPDFYCILDPTLVPVAWYIRNALTDCQSTGLTLDKLLEHLNKVKFTTPQGEEFYFQGADIPAVYDLVNWQATPQGSLKLVQIGRVIGSDLHLNQSAIQWHTGSNQVPVSVCSENCPPGSRVARRKGHPVCCFDCVPCTEGEVSNTTGSLHCERCPLEFWSNTERTACIPRLLEFLSFNETMGITLTAASVTGTIVTAAVFVIFLHYRDTPVVRANNSELSFLLLLSLKLCFLCSLVFIGRPSVWSCRVQQAAFGISFVLCVSCLLVKTIVVLAAFRSTMPGAGAFMKWFGAGQQRGSVCFFTCIQVIICIIWLSLSPPVPKRDLGLQGSKVVLECAVGSVVGFALVLGYIGLLACLCLLLAFLARKLPDNFNEAKLITFSMLIFCAVWVAFVPAYVSSPGKYTVAVEIFAILASSYGLLLCIFTPKCFIILLRPERNTKKHMMSR